MIKLLPKPRTPSSMLGLTLDGSRLHGVLLRRSNGSLIVQKSFTATLALNPLNADPELVGREIRNNLEQAGIRERRCVVCVPLSWALTLQIPLPDLPEADVASFLEIEAERSFAYGPEALSLATSRCRPPNSVQHAMLVGIPRNHLQQLESVLKAAQLRPASFSLGVTALQSPERESSNGVLALAVGENTIDLQITNHGGMAALRSLEDAIETEGGQKRLHADILAREIRVTLGQLSEELRSGVRKVRLFGQGEGMPQFIQDLEPRLEAMGLKVEWVRVYPPDEFRSKPPLETAVTPAFSLAARQLTGAARLEFLPPKVGAFQQLTTRFSSRKLGWVGAATGVAALLIGGAILIQQWQLSRLRSQWTRMAPEVTELEEMQQQIRQYRPWFDESFRSLSILRRLTEAFPADGMVTAKSVEIREQSTVTCSGTARDNQAFLKMLDQLRASKEVGNVKVDQVRGKTPLQFTLNFQWGPGGGSEN